METDFSKSSSVEIFQYFTNTHIPLSFLENKKKHQRNFWGNSGRRIGCKISGETPKKIHREISYVISDGISKETHINLPKYILGKIYGEILEIIFEFFFQETLEFSRNGNPERILK